MHSNSRSQLRAYANISIENSCSTELSFSPLLLNFLNVTITTIAQSQFENGIIDVHSEREQSDLEYGGDGALLSEDSSKF